MTVEKVLLKQNPKNKDFYYLYLMNVPVVYAAVQNPKKKYQSEDTEWSLTAFVDDKVRAYLEDEVLVNKVLHKVGVDKNKKRQVKYPLSSQREDGNDTYDAFKGLNGLSLTLNTKKKNGEPNNLVVVNADGDEIDDLVGNGSVCNIKCFGYRNQDDQLVISLNLVQVVDLVPYEGGDGTIEDEELGIKVKPKQKAVVEPEPNNGFDPDDSDIPF